MHAAQRGDVEIAVVEREPMRAFEAAHDGLALIGDAIVVTVDEPQYLSARRTWRVSTAGAGAASPRRATARQAHVHRAVRAERHETRATHGVREQLDLEPLGDVQLAIERRYHASAGRRDASLVHLRAGAGGVGALPSRVLGTGLRANRRGNERRRDPFRALHGSLLSA